MHMQTYTVELTAILHLDNLDTFGGSKHVYYSVEWLLGRNSFGTGAHVFAVNDDVHVS